MWRDKETSRKTDNKETKNYLSRTKGTVGKLDIIKI